MTQPAAIRLPPRELPESFFRGLPDPIAPRTTMPDRKPNPTAPIRAMVLYDAIIDYMFENPTADLGSVARHLKKGPTTISLIVRSDFFRARWLQRREAFNDVLNFKIAQQMTGVLEASLSKTKEALETRTNIPLPQLDMVNKTILDRLGFTPRSDNAPTQVLVQQNNHSVPATQSASPDGVARAREYMEMLERMNAASGAQPGNAAAPSGDAAGLVVEGEVVGRGDAPSA